MKTAPYKSPFLLNCVKLLGHIFEGNTITLLKSNKDAIFKFQPPSD